MRRLCECAWWQLWLNSVPLHSPTQFPLSYSVNPFEKPCIWNEFSVLGVCSSIHLPRATWPLEKVSKIYGVPHPGSSCSPLQHSLTQFSKWTDFPFIFWVCSSWNLVSCFWFVVIVQPRWAQLFRLSVPLLSWNVRRNSPAFSKQV